jgi:hypothetical protein
MRCPGRNGHRPANLIELEVGHLPIRARKGQAAKSVGNSLIGQQNANALPGDLPAIDLDIGEIIYVPPQAADRFNITQDLYRSLIPKQEFVIVVKVQSIVDAVELDVFMQTSQIIVGDQRIMVRNAARRAFDIEAVISVDDHVVLNLVEIGRPVCRDRRRICRWRPASPIKAWRSAAGRGGRRGLCVPPVPADDALAG